MMGRSHHILSTNIGDNTLNQVHSFKYLGSTVNKQSSQEEEIKNRIAKHSRHEGCMVRLLNDKTVPNNAKQIIHQTLLRRIIICVSEYWNLTKSLKHQITAARGHRMGPIHTLYRHTNIIIIAQVINKVKIRWFGRVTWREREGYSTVGVAMKLNMTGKRPRGGPIKMWLDNIDSHLKGKHASLKEIRETKCFEQHRQGRTTLISRSPSRSSGEDNRASTWNI